MTLRGNFRASLPNVVKSLVAMMTVFALISGCGNSADSSDNGAGGKTTEMTFVTPFGYLVGFAPVLVAKSAGTFADNGLDVEIQGGKGSSQAVQQVVSGQALLSRTGGIDLMKAIANESADIIAVATIAHKSPFNVVSSPKAPINTAEDMKGKTIGIVSPNGATENILDVMLSVAGVNPKSVKREVVGNAPGAYSLVKNGKIDAYIATISTVTSLQQAGENVESWNTDKVAPIPGQVYITKKSSLKKNSGEIVAFLKSVRSSIQSITDKPDGMKSAYGNLRDFKIAGIDDRKESLAKLKKESELWPSADGKYLINTPEAWKTASTLMGNAGLIPNSSDPSKFYTNEYVDEVMGE